MITRPGECRRAQTHRRDRCRRQRLDHEGFAETALDRLQRHRIAERASAAINRLLPDAPASESSDDEGRIKRLILRAREALECQRIDDFIPATRITSNQHVPEFWLHAGPPSLFPDREPDFNART